MKTRYILGIATLVAVMVSCEKEQRTTPVLQPMTFRVNAEQSVDPSASKAALDENRNVTFSAGERISVFDGVANNPFTADASGRAVDFSGNAASAEVYNILSPYDDNATISGNVITATVPKVQTAVLGGADPRALLAVARTSSTGEIHLKNVVGLLKVTVPNNNQVKEIQVAAGAGRNVAIAGTIDITTPASAADVPMYTLNAAAEKVTCVSLVPASGEYLAAGTYYIGVLNKKYEGGLTVAYLTNEGSEDLLRAKTGTADALVERSKVLNLGSLVAGAGQYVKYQGNAIFPAGPDVLLIWKKLANPSVAAFHSDDNTITRIEIKTNTLDGGAGVNSHTGSSPHPIFAILREGVLTLYTRASKAQLAGGAGATNMFRSLKKLETIDFSNVLIGNCTTLQRMFRECGIQEVDLSSLDTKNVTNMSEMFFNCYNLKKVNLTGWKTTSVTSTANENGFAWMFLNATNLEELRLGDDFSITTGGNTTRMFESTSQAVSGRGEKCKLYCAESFWNGLVAVCDPGDSMDPTTKFNKARFDISGNSWYVPEP